MSNSRSSSHRLPFLSQILLVVGGASAQCATSWATDHARLGADSFVEGGAVWDPDGSGPRGPALVVGGQFTIVAGVLGRRVAMMDLATRRWEPIGKGFVVGNVFAVAGLPGGQLVAAGYALQPGTSTASLVRWDGAQWSPLVPTVWQPLQRVVPRPNGNLVAAGTHGLWEIDPVANAVVGSVAWSGTVRDLAVTAAGDVVVASITATTAYLSRWNGVTLAPLAAQPNGPVSSLRAMANGDLLACGAFTAIGSTPATGLARWNGTVWQPVASVPSTATVAVELANGDIAVAGSFTAVQGVAAANIARWNGSAWAPLQQGLVGSPTDLVPLPGGGLVALDGGSDSSLLYSAGTEFCSFLAHHDGTGWVRTGGNVTNAIVFDAAALPDGSIVAVGNFDQQWPILGVKAARWHVGQWVPLGNGPSFMGQVVRVLANGDVWVGGYSGVERWNGSSWSTALGGTNVVVQAIAQAANGDVFVGGSFALPTSAGTATNVARWNGSSWLPVGGGLTAPVQDLLFMPDGALLAASRDVQRWDGATWSRLGPPLGATWSGHGVRCLLGRTDGELLVGGQLLVGPVARWTGSGWAALGALPFGSVLSLAALPDGDVVACGQPFGESWNGMSRWDGASWTTSAPFTSTSPTPPGGPLRLRALPDHQLAVGGYFTLVGDQVSLGLARLSTNCPATGQTYGTGCSGTGGPLVLTVEALPWVGGALRAVTTGVPNGALAIGVGGLAPAAVPLPSILPQGQVGCELLANPDALYLLLPSAGQVHSEIAIPALPGYATKELFHQVVVLEFGAGSALAAVTSSNAVAVTVGSF